MKLLLDLVRALPAPTQVLRADRVFSHAHLARAAELALAAHAGARRRSEDVALEFLAFAAGERQLVRAIARLGLAPARGVAIAAVAFGPRAGDALDALPARAGWRRDDAAIGRADPAGVLDALGVGEAERRVVPRESWEGLVLERVALSAVP